MSRSQGTWRALCGALCIVVAQWAVAQAYPVKAVRIVVPFPPGGPADTLGRMLGEKLAEMWNQPVVIENRGGAAGNIGAEQVARSAPDGYTLLLNASSHIINPSMYSKLAFDAIRDFTPVTEVASYMLVFVVHASVPVKSVAEFVALARSRPGQLVIANAGTGTPTHLAAELFRRAAKLDYVHVPYKGSTPATTDLLGGQLAAMFNNPLQSLPYARTGRLRALAVTGAHRLKIAPELPTIAESGYPGFSAGTWYGVLGPAGLPKEVVQKVYADTVKALRMRDVQEKLAVQGWDTTGSSPAEFTSVMKSDFDKWSKLIREAGIKGE